MNHIFEIRIFHIDIIQLAPAAQLFKNIKRIHLAAIHLNGDGVIQRACHPNRDGKASSPKIPRELQRTAESDGNHGRRPDGVS